MADRPLKELNNKTCLQKARTPNMDKLASEGEAGKVRTILKVLNRGLMLQIFPSRIQPFKILQRQGACRG
jgi:hypothetical protein